MSAVYNSYNNCPTFTTDDFTKMVTSIHKYVNDNIAEFVFEPPVDVKDTLTLTLGVMGMPIGLYDQTDVFIYPSWGEGFGFQPLQALAMGMPTICVDEWADYRKYITWPVDSKWTTSPWQSKHPGMMVKPNKETLKKQMLNSVENYAKVLPETFRNSFSIHREYDWLEVTKPAVARLKEIYANLLLEKKYFNLDDLKKRS